MLSTMYLSINPARLTLRDQNTPVSQFTMLQVCKRFLNALLVQRELLNHWLDVVYRCELQHLVMNRSRRYNAPLNAKATHQQRHVWELKIAFRDGQWEDRSSGSQYGGIQGIVWLRAGGDEEVIDRLDGVLELLWPLDILHSVKLHRTQLGCLFFFAVRATKDYHLAAHVGRELNGEMP